MKETYRMIMEKKLGRQLLSEEVVHHINGNSKDNRIRNLMIFSSNSDHLRYHIKNRNMRTEEMLLLKTGLEIYMREHNYSTNNIADKINRNWRTIHRFLRGKTIPRPQTLYKIRQLTTKIKIENRP